VIVSPPRCSSTAFARVLWQHPSIGYYSHEPFEVTYFDGEGVGEVAAKLRDPLDLSSLNGVRERGEGLLVKEMPYQVGDRFPEMASLASKPLVFLMRDPRQNIASRMEMKERIGDSRFFPSIETGWELLLGQVEQCRRDGRRFAIIDSADFRNEPGDVFPQVARLLGLSWEPSMLTWRAHPDLDLDNLGGRHTHLYRRVLESTGLEPANEPVPPLSAFPAERGWRDHVVQCLAVYDELSTAPERLSA
jgi:hypothetical protein